MYAYSISELYESKYYSVTEIGYDYGSLISTNCRLEKINNRNLPKFSNFPFESGLISLYPYNYLNGISISDSKFNGYPISKNTVKPCYDLDEGLIFDQCTKWKRM